MNRQIEDNLEAYLSGSLSAAGLTDFERALEGSDAALRQTIARMEKQSRLMRSALRPPEQMDPGAGFYARVMDRIEAQRASSPFWAGLIEPLFFKRLVVASATLMLLLGLTLFTGSVDDNLYATPPHLIMAAEPEPMVTVTTVKDGEPEGRDMVLGDLTTYQE